MSGAQEIERKFLVDGELPVDLDDYPSEPVSQGYISIDPNGTEVRLRGLRSSPSSASVASCDADNLD